MTRLSDPFSFSSAFGNPFGSARAATRASQSITLSPEEEASLISEIGSSALSGLSYVGETLDKPGRAIRGLLGGRPEELLNLLPFSDTLGITDPADSVSGRDLLEQAGILGANTEGFDFGDVLGFGAEVLTDPLLLLGGPLSVGGRAAKSANLLAKATKGAAKAGKGKRLFRMKTTPRQLIAEAEDSVAARKAFTSAFNKGKPLGAVSDDILDAPLGGLQTLRVPFMEPFATLGTGPLAQKFAGKVLDPLGEAIRFSGPGRALSRAFQPSVLDRSTEFGQKLAPDVFEARRAASADAAGAVGESLQNLNRAVGGRTEATGGAFDLLNPDLRRQVFERVRTEGGGFDAERFGKIAKRVLGSTATPEQLTAATKSFQLPIDTFDDIIKRGREWGYGAEELFDPEIGYLPRFLVGVQPGSRGARGFDLLDPSNIAREDIFKGLAKGTSAIKQLASDKTLNELIKKGANAEQIAKYISGSQRFSRLIPNEFTTTLTKKLSPKQQRKASKLVLQRAADTGQDAQALLRGDTKEAKALQKELRKLLGLKGKRGKIVQFKDDGSVIIEKLGRREAIAESLLKRTPGQRAVGLFGNDPLVDAATRIKSGLEAGAIKEKTLTQLVDDDIMAEVMEAAQKAAGDGVVETIPLSQVLRTAQRAGEKGLGFKTKQRAVWEKVAELKGIELPDIVDADSAAEFKAIIQGLKDIQIPVEFADDLMRMENAFRAPDAAKGLMRVLDKSTNLFKSLQTSPWPAFHSRNLLGGQFNNIFGGIFNGKDVARAKAILSGQSPKGLGDIPILAQRLSGKGLKVTDDNLADEFRLLASEHGIAGKFQGQQFGGELDDVVSATLEDVGRSIPGGIGGSTPVRPTRAAGEFFGIGDEATLNPRKATIRGTSLFGEPAAKTTFGPVKAGETLGEFVEGLNRLSPFMTQLRRGVDPAQAAAKVFAAQVDYSSRAFSRLERDLFLKAFPFYKFQSRMLPFTVRQLIENPGGRLAQTIRGINNARGDSGLVPDFVAGTAAIPVGGGEEGGSRFLTGFGLAPEDPLELIGRTGQALTGDIGAVKQLGLNLLSRTIPPIKAPLEVTFGQSTFQTGPQGGRPLEDQDPLVGRLLSNIGQATGLRDSSEPVDVPFAGIVEPFAAASPPSRFLRFGRDVLDQREGRALSSPLSAGATATNLLTGFRITDVSTRTKDALLRERIQQLLKEHPGAAEFTKVFVSREAREKLPPEERAAVEQLMALNALLASKARARREAAKN